MSILTTTENSSSILFRIPKRFKNIDVCSIRIDNDVYSCIKRTSHVFELILHPEIKSRLPASLIMELDNGVTKEYYVILENPEKIVNDKLDTIIEDVEDAKENIEIIERTVVR